MTEVPPISIPAKARLVDIYLAVSFLSVFLPLGSTNPVNEWDDMQMEFLSQGLMGTLMGACHIRKLLSYLKFSTEVLIEKFIEFNNYIYKFPYFFYSQLNLLSNYTELYFVVNLRIHYATVMHN